MSKDLLLEIGTEELPALAAEQALDQMAAKGRAALENARLAHGELRTLGTPRRLVLSVTGLAENQDAIKHEVKGPAKVAAFAEDGTPQAPAAGFAKSQGVTVEDLITKSVGTGEYVFAVKEEEGLPAEQLLPAILQDLVGSLSFAKSMRWGTGEFRFARPIRWIAALFGADVVDFAIDGLASGRVTHGHRLLAPGAIEVSGPADYLSKIEAARVVLDQSRRADMIRDQAQAAACEIDGTPVLHDVTFREVVQLVECPHVVLGSFSEEYARLPREVLVAAMESHQRYFPVDDGSGTLTHRFVVVHNGDPACADAIRRGHERVLRARLADAAFFFSEDRKEPLAAKAAKLKGVVYQEKLGSYLEKQVRVGILVAEIAKDVDADAESMAAAKQAAALCKADLVTEMVAEFPVLQGTMGEIYARTSGETEATARAIGEHYKPAFSGDDLPETLAGQILSAADKIDSTVGCFGVGVSPSGSQDPYGLRRQALGVITVIFEKSLPVRLDSTIEKAVEAYGDVLGDGRGGELQSEVRDFFHQRARNYLLAKGHSYDLVDAVLSAGLNDLPARNRTLAGIAKFREDSGMDELLVPFGRCKNLAKPELGEKVTAHLLEEPAERALLEAIDSARAQVEAAVGSGDIDEVLRILAGLRKPVDKFFDDVLVMAEDADVRDNRLRLLNRGVALFERIADFSKVVQQG